MKKQKQYPETSILSTDFKEQERDIEFWIKKREAKMNIYESLSNYISCLEESLKHETDSHKRYVTQQEIKKLRKLQKKFDVLPILSMNLGNNEATEEDKMKKWHDYQQYIMQLKEQLAITVNIQKRAEIEMLIEEAKRSQEQLLISDSIEQTETRKNKNYKKNKNLSYNYRNEE